MWNVKIAAQKAPIAFLKGMLENDIFGGGIIKNTVVFCYISINLFSSNFFSSKTPGWENTLPPPSDYDSYDVICNFASNAPLKFNNTHIRVATYKILNLKVQNLPNKEFIAESA